MNQVQVELFMNLAFIMDYTVFGCGQNGETFSGKVVDLDKTMVKIWPKGSGSICAFPYTDIKSVERYQD